MSLQLAAQHLASRGRGPDTTLVHMAPQEVAGLQALAKAAGGTLTTNPDTGLPEAGFLKNLLPTLIGFGIQATTGIPAWAIGLGIGGLETARTGSLGKGMMAGLGAYGGAGIGAGLAGAGAGAAQQAAMSAVPQGTATAAHTAAQQAAMEGLTGAAANEAAANASKQLLAQGFGSDAAIQNLAAGQASQQFAAQPLNARLSQGLGALGTEAGRSQAVASMGGGMSAAKYGLAAAAPAILGSGAVQTPYVSGKPNYEYAYDAGTGQYTRMPVGTRDSAASSPPMFSSPVQTITPMAEGGPVGEMSERNQMLTLMANGGQMYAGGGIARFATGGGIDAIQGANPSMPQDTYGGVAPAPSFLQEPAMMAAGGLSHLGDYSDGGRLLKGPGDGVSDSIPATIADKRPARLADGEFVVPARIVSELGNGSTDAGARKLYAMMDRVQKARGKTTGKDRVAVNSRAEKALPA